MPLPRIASSTLNVAIVFCSRSLRGCSRPKRTSALAERWKTMSQPAIAAVSAGTSRMSPSASLNSGCLSAPARNSRKPVLKLSKPVTENPAASRRSTRLLPINPAAPVTNAFLFEGAIRRCPDRSDELVAGAAGVIVEHLDRFERVLAQVLAGQRQLGNDVRCRGDDVATARIRLRDVEYLARARPQQFRLRQMRQSPDRFGHDRDWIDPGIGDAAGEHRDDRPRRGTDGRGNNVDLLERQHG